MVQIFGKCHDSYCLYIPVNLLYQINFQDNKKSNNVPHKSTDKNETPNKLTNIVLPHSPSNPPNKQGEKNPQLARDRNTEGNTAKKIRIIQTKFREDLIKYWAGKCAVTGFGVRELLKASHIKPWKDCKDNKGIERRDKFNGLLLAPGLDSAFDKGYITFRDIDGSMLISEDLSKNNKELLGIVAEYPKLSKLDDKHKVYLRYHINHIYEKWKK